MDVEDGAIMIGRDTIYLIAHPHGFVTTLPVDGESGTTSLLGVTQDQKKCKMYKFEDLDKGHFISVINKDMTFAIAYKPKGGVVQMGWEIAL